MRVSSASIGLGVQGIDDGAQMSLRSGSGVEGGSLGSSLDVIVYGMRKHLSVYEPLDDSVCRTDGFTASIVYPARCDLVHVTKRAPEILARGSVRLTDVPNWTPS